jgi:hypothetical protein
MPNLLENTAAQNATTSNQGTNKIPKLDAKCHFFLEDEAYTQLPNQAFGVIYYYYCSNGSFNAL